MHAQIAARPVLGLLALAVLPLSLTACSSSSTSGGSGATSPTTQASTATTAADPDAALPTGTQLKADLVTSGLPSKFALDASGSVDTGGTYQPPSADATSPGCSALEGTSWINLAGYGSVSFAQNDYISKDTSEEFAQEIDAFQGTTAQDVMTALSKINAKCPSFTDSQTNSKVTVTVTTATTPGDGSVTISLDDTSWVGNETLEAVRVGHSVVTVLSSTNSGSAALASSMAAQITGKLAAGAN
jgi:hypothetical protein